MSDPLHVRIKRRIQEIPVSNPGYISCLPETISSVLSNQLLERIAIEAEKEAQDYYHERASAESH